MGSVATSSFSITNLLISLTSSGSPQLAATLSSATVQTAMKSAPTSDLVELSAQALKFQETELLFGGSSTANTATIPSALDPLSSLLSSAESTVPAQAGSGTNSPSSNTNSSAASLANQLTGYQSDLQSEDMQALFGIASTGPPPSALFDVLA